VRYSVLFLLCFAEYF